MAFRDVIECVDDLRDTGLRFADAHATFEHGEFRLWFLYRTVEQRELEADLIDLLAIGTEVLFREGQGLDVFAAGELHLFGCTMALGGGEAVLEFGQFGLFARF